MFVSLLSSFSELAVMRVRKPMQWLVVLTPLKNDIIDLLEKILARSSR